MQMDYSDHLQDKMTIKQSFAALLQNDITMNKTIIEILN